INEISGEGENDGEAYAGRGDHPAALAAILRFHQAALGIVRGGGSSLDVRSSLPLAENHQRRGAKHKDEEEEFIAHDGAKQSHFVLAGRNPAGFAKFVEAGNRELDTDENQDDAGDSEEAVQWYLERALEEEEADGNGGADADDGADPSLQAFGGK